MKAIKRTGTNNRTSLQFDDSERATKQTFKRVVTPDFYYKDLPNRRYPTPPAKELQEELLAILEMSMEGSLWAI
jgi:hypothetical protein